MTASANKAKDELIVLAVVLLTALLIGCATTPKDYSAFTDEELLAEHDKLAQKIANAQAQLTYLEAQAAYAVTPEESAASNLSAAIAAAQLNSLRTNQASALQEAQRRVAQRHTSESTPEPVQAPQREAPLEIPVPSQPKSSVSSESKSQIATPSVAFPVYTGSSQGHWVADLLSDGHYVLLEDNSVWEVDLIDTVDSALWLMTENVVVVAKQYQGYIFYDLINTDSEDKVAATYLGMAVLRTQLEGDFEGWDGDTVFVLANGKVLKQLGYAYVYHYAYRPDVIVVERGGMLILVVDGVEEAVSVVVVR